jgi:hypothetical protein
MMDSQKKRDTTELSPRHTDPPTISSAVARMFYLRRDNIIKEFFDELEAHEDWAVSRGICPEYARNNLLTILKKGI